MVTEMPYHSALRCVSGIRQNNAKPLISNGLRFIVTCLLTAALWVLFHCFRHSFITNIMANGANIKTAASLAGHSTTRHTEKYVHIIDELKQKAVDSLPDLTINY